MTDEMMQRILSGFTLINDEPEDMFKDKRGDHDGGMMSPHGDSDYIETGTLPLSTQACLGSDCSDSTIHSFAEQWPDSQRKDLTKPAVDSQLMVA